MPSGSRNQTKKVPSDCSSIPGKRGERAVAAALIGRATLLD